MAEIKMTSKNEYVIVIPNELDLDTVTKVEIRGREFSEQPKIVRCMDCKWFQCNMKRDGSLPNGVPEYECRHWCGECDPIDFCSYGERRKE